MGDWTEEIEREERVDPPVHPGEVLREEWLMPLDFNANPRIRSVPIRPYRNRRDAVGALREAP